MVEYNIVTSYIYLLQEREFIKTNENIFKIGMTKRENTKRFNQYPKGSILLFQVICQNAHLVEKEIIKEYKTKFIQRNDIGNEYFQGNFEDMISLMYSIRNKYVLNHFVTTEFKKEQKVHEENKKQLEKQQKKEQKQLEKKERLQKKELEKQKKKEKKESEKQIKELEMRQKIIEELEKQKKIEEEQKYIEEQTKQLELKHKILGKHNTIINLIKNKDIGNTLITHILNEILKK